MREETRMKSYSWVLGFIGLAVAVSTGCSGGSTTVAEQREETNCHGDGDEDFPEQCCANRRMREACGVNPPSSSTLAQNAQNYAGAAESARANKKQADDLISSSKPVSAAEPTSFAATAGSSNGSASGRNLASDKDGKGDGDGKAGAGEDTLAGSGRGGGGSGGGGGGGSGSGPLFGKGLGADTGKKEKSDEDSGQGKGSGLGGEAAYAGAGGGAGGANGGAGGSGSGSGDSNGIGSTPNGETLSFGADGSGVDQGAGFNVLKDADPSDYFGRTNAEMSIFKIVEMRYTQKAINMKMQDNAASRLTKAAAPFAGAQ